MLDESEGKGRRPRDLRDHRCGDGGTSAAWAWVSGGGVSGSTGDRADGARNTACPRGGSAGLLQGSTTRVRLSSGLCVFRSCNRRVESHGNLIRERAFPGLE